MSLAIVNIRGLVNPREDTKLLIGRELSVLPVIENAYVLIEGNEIASYGPMRSYAGLATKQTIDATGKFVFPAWCDSHSHLVFATAREEEFVQKIKGASYAEIAAKGGGILNSSRKLNKLSEDDLFALSWKRLQEVMLHGTGAIEIKSGYGLSLEGELKMLRVIKRLKEKSTLLIRSTFLGAHTFPEEYKDSKESYIDLIIEEMLPAIHAEKLADYIDVFCEDGFFSAEQTERICKAGIQYGLKPKIHANQMNRSGGVQAGINVNARSVDHLENIGSEEIKLLALNPETIATLLPTAAFFLRMSPPPARKLIDSGAAVAIASDYNPGSSPGGNMNFVVSLSCIQMGMIPEEAINAATVNGAFAMDVQQSAGSITVGKKANLFITREMPSIAYLPYSFSYNCIDCVIIAGECVN